MINQEQEYLPVALEDITVGLAHRHRGFAWETLLPTIMVISNVSVVLCVTKVNSSLDPIESFRGSDIAYFRGF